jgi:TRAP-type mannitol/chloroaromatic compound transport system substrate-binding protein
MNETNNNLNKTVQVKKLSTAIMLESQECWTRKADTDVSKNERGKKLLDKWSAILDVEDKWYKEGHYDRTACSVEES